VQVLVVNAGSSSLKLRLLDGSDRVVATKDLPSVAPDEMGGELDAFLEASPEVDAAGHRVVHGGSVFTQPIVLDDTVDESLGMLTDLAPLHNPRGLAAIAALRELRPDLPQVACFDTSFHATMPAKAATYAVPVAWRERWGIRRYGFHGLSHAWASRRAGVLMGRPAEGLRLVTAHLGAGASLAAVAHGTSVDTTMGFTPMEGLVMATRSGTVDPGLILWVQRRGPLSADEVEHVLEYESGLLGLSGMSGDLRLVIDAADAGLETARLAYDVYVYRLQTAVAAMTAAMGGIDGLVFTGGAGEASSRLRADTCIGLGFLGVGVEDARNEDLSGDGIVSPPEGAPEVVVVQAREDLEIARHVRELLR
jgi:acetate kinase